jgi:YD repeat-containing protein
VSLLDAFGRVAQTTRQVESGLESVTATYDAEDRITRMSLQDGAVDHSFRYDTLGRLVYASDPDTGERRMTYDDRGFLIDHVNGIGQHVYFTYDDAGRLTRRGESQGPNPATDYVFTYDDPATAFQSSGCQVLGRLSSVTEPSGQARFCYDAFARQTALGRTIVAAAGPSTGGQQSEYSPSGLLLETHSDDLFAVGYKYDGAGRAICIRTPPANDPAKCRTLPGTATDDYWVGDELDASNRVLREHYGNGAIQTYQYDVLGLAEHIRLDQPGGGPTSDLFEIMVTRNSYGAPKTIQDLDGRNLDHSATYTYDTAARLTDATLGRLSAQHAFTYRYDALQNMTLRQVRLGGMPRDIGALTGAYRYGERGYGPRQLTSVTPEVAP